MRIPTPRHELENTSMTPMIDVIFQLLIFFVCASAGQTVESHLPTELAAGSVESVAPIEVERPFGEVWLRLKPRADGVTLVELNDREYADDPSLRKTLLALAETTPEIPVILDIEGAVPLGEVVRVYDACQSAQFRQVSFATKLVPKQ
ncbi:MAG: ExbD/TolR family protein [Planctomycetaceae bacterium]